MCVKCVCVYRHTCVHESKYAGKHVPSSQEFVHDGLLLFQQLGFFLLFFFSSFSAKSPSCLLRTSHTRLQGPLLTELHQGWAHAWAGPSRHPILDFESGVELSWILCPEEGTWLVSHREVLRLTAILSSLRPLILWGPFNHLINSLLFYLFFSWDLSFSFLFSSFLSPLPPSFPCLLPSDMHCLQLKNFIWYSPHLLFFFPSVIQFVADHSVSKSLHTMLQFP